MADGSAMSRADFQGQPVDVATSTADTVSLPVGRRNEHGFSDSALCLTPSNWRPLTPGFFFQAWCFPRFRCSHCGVWNYEFWPMPSYGHYGTFHVPTSSMENLPNRGNSESAFGATADKASNRSATNIYEAHFPEASAPGTNEQSLDLCDFDEEKEDEEVEFVLTDEWIEFFAKSEERRQERKLQRKRDAKAARKS